MKIGYVRVPKQEQNEALQIDALKKQIVANGLWTNYRIESRAKKD